MGGTSPPGGRAADEPSQRRLLDAGGRAASIFAVAMRSDRFRVVLRRGQRPLRRAASLVGSCGGSPPALSKMPPRSPSRRP